MSLFRQITSLRRRFHSIRRCSLAYVALTLVLQTGLASFPSDAAATVIRPFTTRFQANTAGKIYLTGNINVHAGIEVAGNNNNYAMLNVDIDGNPTTFNSSSANFALPPGASVLWAGLYWGADTETVPVGSVPAPDYNSRDRVKFNTGSGYQTIVSQIPLDQNSGGYRYQGFAEVTNLIRNQPAGTTRTYTTADIQAATNTGNSHYAGWGLIVAINDPAEVLRHLHIFDGFVQIDPTTPTDTTTVTGFRTPLAGTFNTEAGMIAYEGDLVTAGDSFQVNGSTISDPLNPANNFFNSTITREGLAITAKNPNYNNQLGFDIDTVDIPYASGIIANGDTSASLTFAMSGDWYYPGALTFAIDVYDPVLQGNITKSMIDLNGGALYGNDIVEFVIRIGNTGNDNATNVVLTDPIPPGTTFLPGSLVISEGPNLGAKTDGAGDDQAQFDAGNNRVVFRIGTGANGINGGTIGISEWTEARFRVTIDSAVPPGTTITNSATVDFIGENSGLPFSATSNLYEAVAGLYCDLAVTKTVADNLRAEGLTTNFTVTVHNNGPDDSTEVAVTDILPAGFLLQTATPSQGSYNAGNGIWSVGTLANGATANLDLLVQIAAGAGTLPQPLVNSTSAIAKQIDTILTNNSASASVTAYAPSNLATSTKLWVDLNGGDQNPGDVLRYTITLIESNGAAATNVSLSDTIDGNFTDFAVVNIPAGATDASTPGSGPLNVTGITVPAGGSVAIVFDVTIAAIVPGTPIDNTATIGNPTGTGATPAAPTVSVAASSIPGSGNKPLYLHNAASTPPYKLSRTPMAVAAASFVAIPRGGGTQTWTLSPALAADVTITGGGGVTIPVRLWLGTNDSRTYNTTRVTLYCGAANVATQALNIPLTGTATAWDFALPLAANYTCPATSFWALSVTNNMGAGGGARDIRVYPAPSAGNYSNVTLSSQDVINVDSLTYYDAAYPGGSVITSAAPGQLVSVRATVSDPFGSYDINSNPPATLPTITLTDPNGNPFGPVAMTELGALTTAGTKTFEYVNTVPGGSFAGSWSVRVDAVEGTEGNVSDYAIAALPVVIPPANVTLVKATTNIGTTGYDIPGETVRYTLVVTNADSRALDNDSIVLVDPIPVNTALVAVDPAVTVSNVLATTGLTLAYLGLTSVADQVGFSADGGATFSYQPVNSSGGIDPSVTHIRFVPTGSMNGGTSFTVTFKVRIK